MSNQPIFKKQIILNVQTTNIQKTVTMIAVIILKLSFVIYLSYAYCNLVFK